MPPPTTITVNTSALSSTQWQQPTKDSSSLVDSSYINLLKSSPPPSFTKSITGIMNDDHNNRRRRGSTLRCSMISIGKKTTTKNKKRNSVKFDDGESSCVVHQLESTDDVYPQELWFSKQEIQDIRKEGRDILAKVKDAGCDVSAALMDDIRGLEHGLSVRDCDGGSFSSAVVELAAPLGRSERRKNIVETILSQQQEQKDAGIDDPKGLAVTSKACTQWASDRAYDVATKDFEDAVEIYRSEPACAEILPSILNKKRDMRRRRSSVMSSTTSAASVMTADERKAALENISQTVASALEELDDLDF